MENQSDSQAAGGSGAVDQQFSVGAALREAREQLGLSVADVANRIKFAPRQIEAMEEDDYVHLPEATFVRGFVRSYARLLEIDAIPLLAALPKTHLQPVAAAEKKPVEVPFPSTLTSRRSNIAWIAGGLAVALVLIIFSRLHDSPSKPEQAVTQTNVETLELPASALAAASAPVLDTTAALPAIPPAREVQSVPSVKAQVPFAQQVKDKPVKERGVQEPVNKDVVALQQLGQKPVTQEKPVSDKVVKTQAAKELAPMVRQENGVATELTSLRLVFDEDSWVDVKDANGKVLLSRMNHAGSLVRLSGVAPLSVVIGHASGVHLFYKGKEVNLVPHTSVEVARLVLE